MVLVASTAWIKHEGVWLTLVSAGLLLVAVAIAYAVGLGVIHLFSAQPFPWVMTATLTRGLMLPTLLLTLAALAALANVAAARHPLSRAGNQGSDVKFQPPQPPLQLNP